MSQEVQHRRFSLELEERRKTPEPTRYRASLSSEIPVEREYGFEVLLHSPEAVDLTRARDGLPLLMYHDHQRPVGVAENVRLYNRRLVADLRFFSTEAGQEAERMVSEGLQSLSVGYIVNQKRETAKRGGIPVFTVERWALLEVSIAPVAADPTVGIGRETPHIEVISERKSAMEMQQVSEADRVKTLVALGDQYGKYVRPGDVRAAIDEGRSPEQFREVILTRMESRPLDASQRMVGMTPAEANRYSLARALQASVTGDWQKAGLEREASRALERTNGRSAEGFFVPAEVWGRRAFEPRARHGEVVMADPQGQAKLGQEVLAIRADGSVQLGDLVASCGGGAFNLRTPRGDYFCLRPGDATLAPVLAISLGVPDGMRRPAPGGSA